MLGKPFHTGSLAVKPLLYLLLVATMLSPSASAEKEMNSIALATTPSSRSVDWWAPRHAEKLAERDAYLAKQGSPSVVFVGDSITQGWEKGNGQSVWKENIAPRGAMNLGFSGDRTEHVLWRLGAGEAGEANNELAGLSPNVIVLLIGTNNTGHRQEPAESTAKGVELIVDRLTATCPASQILLLAIFPRGAAADDPLRVLNDQINDKIALLGERENVDFVDINTAFLAAEDRLRIDLMPDKLHLNTAGYRLWQKALEPHLDRLLP